MCDFVSIPYGIVMAAVKRHGMVLSLLDDIMKGDRDLCAAAVAQYGLALRYASGPLKGDRELCVAAVIRNWRAFEHCSPEMRKDHEVCEAAIVHGIHNKDPAELHDIFDMLPPMMKQDESVLKMACSACLFECTNPREWHCWDHICGK